MPPPHLGWQYKEVMPSSWGAVKKSTDLHSDWISSQILLTSRVPASARSTPPFRQSQHGSFLGVGSCCSEQFGTVQWPELTYSPSDIQSSSNFDWKYVGLHIKIPFYFVGAINSVATILCTLTFVSKEASNDPLPVQKSSAREKQAHVNEQRERPSITQDYNPQRSKACEISCEGNKNQSDHWTKHMPTEWHMPNVARHASQCLCCG